MAGKSKQEKKTTAKFTERPIKMKDGTIKCGNRSFANEEELLCYLNEMPIVDSERLK